MVLIEDAGNPVYGHALENVIQYCRNLLLGDRSSGRVVDGQLPMMADTAISGLLPAATIASTKPTHLPNGTITPAAILPSTVVSFSPKSERLQECISMGSQTPYPVTVTFGFGDTTDTPLQTVGTPNAICPWSLTIGRSGTLFPHTTVSWSDVIPVDELGAITLSGFEATLRQLTDSNKTVRAAVFPSIAPCLVAVDLTSTGLLPSATVAGTDMPANLTSGIDVASMMMPSIVVSSLADGNSFLYRSRVEPQPLYPVTTTPTLRDRTAPPNQTIGDTSEAIEPKILTTTGGTSHAPLPPDTTTRADATRVEEASAVALLRYQTAVTQLIDSSDKAGKTKLFSFIKRYLRMFKMNTRYTAQEIFREAYLRLLKSGQHVNDILAWLGQAALNVIREFARKRDRGTIGLTEREPDGATGTSGADSDSGLDGLCRLFGTTQLRGKTMETLLLKLVVALVEPLVPVSFRDESIGDILELHYSMKQRGTAGILRSLITVCRLLDLLRGALHMRLQEFLATKKGRTLMTRCGFSSGGK
ncbi:MAG: sigma-70 family RNA polymerase sigma factor [Leptolyngbya sp. SIO1E4]|nr:sigma-70 family RNA polymerase sigma factor [Leptolyngbya sp. SIO1E4]